ELGETRRERLEPTGASERRPSALVLALGRIRGGERRQRRERAGTLRPPRSRELRVAIEPRALFVERPQPRLHLTQPFLHRIGGQRRLAERLARGGELLRRVAKRVGVAVKLFEAGLQMPETVRG